MKQLLFALMLVILASCSNDKPTRTTYTKGNFTLELVEKSGTKVTFKVIHNNNHDFAFAECIQSQSSPMVEQIRFVHGSSGVINNMTAGSDLYLYEYERTEGEYKRLKHVETIRYVISAFN